MELKVGDSILVKRYRGGGEYRVLPATVTSVGFHGIRAVNTWGLEDWISPLQYDSHILAVSPITKEQSYFLDFA